MPNLSVCKDCPDNDDFYGCMNDDCEVYQDLEAEYKMEMAADFEHDKRKEERMGY